MCKISILIPTFNCAQSVEATLKSVSWADEIVIIDSYSTDDTLEVVRKYTSKIYQRIYDTPSQQKNWALKYCTYDWVLQLDSDEELNTDAELIIRNAIMNAGVEITLFNLPRKNHALGRWIRHGGLYPDLQTRLFRKSKGFFNQNIVHEKIETIGNCKTLPCLIMHYGMPNISSQLKNFDRYTRYEADGKNQKGRSFSYIKWLLFPVLIFLYRFFWLQGYRDGWRGLFLAVYNSFYYFVSQSKLKELEELKLDRSP